MFQQYLFQHCSIFELLSGFIWSESKPRTSCMTCRKIDSALKFFACLIDLQSFFTISFY